jgi:hypothetical protein
MWFYLAAAEGDYVVQEHLKDIEGKGLFKSPKLSSEEIARAKQRAEEFLAQQKSRKG